MTIAGRSKNVLLSRPASSWNASLRELAKQGRFREGVELYREMLQCGVSPNAFSFPFTLKSCSALSSAITGTQIHSHVVKSGCEPEPFVQSSLISFYCRLSFPEMAGLLFDRNPYSKAFTVCYNALIAGYASNSRFTDSVSVFSSMRQMGVAYNSVTLLGLLPVCSVPPRLRAGTCFHAFTLFTGLDSNVSVGNCLLSMYLRCGSVDLARDMFGRMSNKDLITWNAIISGYAQNGYAQEVLNLYQAMGISGISPDPVTFVSVLASCAHLGAKSIGRMIERRIEASRFVFNPNLRNALINMHARCGNLSRAREIFDGMHEKNLVSWTSMISGYGIHGNGEIAVHLFDEMICTGIEPDEAVFVCVLSACSHSGLADKGFGYFHSMTRDYGLQPGLQHFACMVDLLGRVGRLKAAHDLVRSMPVKPDGAVWGALLGACRIHRNVEIAELAFEKVIESEPMNAGYYALLVNIHLEANNMDGVAKIRAEMREKNLRKEPGHSYFEIGGRVHLFFAGDKGHPQADDLYRILARMERCVALETGKQSVLKKVGGMMMHSEKLAVAFGLLNTEPGDDIVVIKNLRVCVDCHLFLKAASKITNRRLIIRDATRFHHFVNGACSCRDYW